MSVRCLFCGSDNSVPGRFPRATYFEGRRFNYLRCCDCALVFIDPLPGEADLEAMYSSAYHDQFYFHESPNRHAVATVQRLHAHAPGRRLLDYGCGDGSFLATASQFGFQCSGVEYNPDLVKRLRGTYPSMRFWSVQEFDSIQAEYDAIHAGDVLEHLPDPVHFLERLRSRLEPGALVCFEGPLENNAHLGLAVRKWISSLRTGPAAHPPYHLSFSNATNQEQLFVRAGYDTRIFEVSEWTWPYPDRPSLHPYRLFQFAVARLSILTSQMLPGFRWGNRFLYVGSVLAR